MIAYRNHLLSLAAANTTAATATGRAAAATVGATAASRAASSTLAALGGAIGGVVGMIVGSLLGAIMQWVASLWEADKATKAVTAASDGMADAQSALGKIFDTTTGKIQNQNEMLRLNARLLAANLRAEALAAKTQAASAINEAGERSWRSIWMDNVPGSRWGESRNTLAKRKLQGVLDGTLNSEDAQQWAERANFSGVSISRQDFMEAVARALEARLKRETADEISKSLNSGELSPVFRQEARPSVDRATSAARGASRASGLSEEARAMEERNRATDRYIESLTQEVATIGLSDKALRDYEAAQALGSRAFLQSRRDQRAKSR